MNLLLVIETIQPSYGYYTTQCCNDLSHHVLFARICNSSRVILISIYLCQYLSKQSDDHLNWRATGNNASGSYSHMMHEICSILRIGPRVVAIEFFTSPPFGEYWTSYVTIDCEHDWWWTSAEVRNDRRVMLQSKSPLSLSNESLLRFQFELNFSYAELNRLMRSLK